MSAPEKVSEVLDQAADILTGRGWFQGGYAPQGPGVDLQRCPVCVLGAINLATGNDVNEWYDYGGEGGLAGEAAIALAETLDLDDSDDCIAEVVGDGWNDKVAESAQQVIEALREAAQHEREAGR